ncbi:transglutaminase family protein [Fontimonas sp. SYSU GA230001]|uniref:transglutaminase family protein n=1 Tax=Fontimonas sp. SYSU GA230001 TaxID=3142450 RepID=UPI0032B58887
MSIHAALHHLTRYRYDRRVSLSPQIIRLRPAPHTRTAVLSYALHIAPDPHFINWQQDPFGNWQARVVFPDKVTEFSVTVDLVADLTVINPFDFFIEDGAQQFPFDYEPALAADLAPYRRPLPAGPLLQEFLATIAAERKQTVAFLVELNRRLQQEIRYLIRMEPGVQSPEQTLELASGSCRDSAWLLVQILRHLGLAARFVSGYLLQLKPDVKPLEGPVGAVADFTDLHAWTEVYVPGAGWLGLDPTSGLFAGEGHIPLSATPDPASAAPISGSVEDCEVEFSHEMRIQRIHESPRVTLPYSEEDWAAIDRLGGEVDARLARDDVRLTMGGEPTFVAADDMQSAEWNTAAVGPTKAQRALDLALRLRERHAPQGLLTYGQGKWYPGESLPRWAYTLYWRRDGAPLWRLPLRTPDANQPATLLQANQFMLGLAERLDVDPRNVCEAYEDALHYLVRERKLPVNLDPQDNRLKDPEERARLLQVFERGLGTPRGYVLPVQRWQSAARWMSERWLLRTNKLFLIPGDSPIGLRLPIDSLPWTPGVSVPASYPADPWSLPSELPPLDPRRQPFLQMRAGAAPAAREQRIGAPPARPAPRGRYVNGQNVRTALTVEPREGWITVFLPPVARTEDFIDLVAAIEDVAAETALPVRVEGYSPPPDARLELLKITPDPGVIEVNVQPARSWAELRDNTLSLYEAARQSRLSTEKFLIDGRAVGTGGGNHVVVGGATPADSPFLRRPDVLASLLRYWQNHPSLSYFFSGLFIGPTSQHPRIDEARDSQIYELEIALAQLPHQGETVAPWLVDRVLRNLLTDLTGNTHRAEVCIDKLYSPDSPSGRLGLVELRGFEMPPHARMSLVQQLLVRALIGWFWREPYARPLVRWGTQLHDRWMLPYDNWLDLCEVLDELTRAGFAFERQWFAPHFEFRFPCHGVLRFQGMELELRHALEPWPVLGEEPGAGGTTRYVDSSVERLQVRVTGLTPGRHSVTCNGRELPLRATGQVGEHVAGVRYRAWQPAACLHPTIGVHTPLVFDLYDRWSGRALAGCTYHVAHPAGRNYETFPVNAFEAEARRLARFEPLGHTPGPFRVAAERPNPDFPCTLDLRRPSV